MIKRIFSWLPLLFAALVCFLPKSGDCQDLTVKGVAEFMMYTYNVDWLDVNSNSFKALVNDTQTAINQTLTKGLTFVNLTTETRARDGLYRIRFTLRGGATEASVWFMDLSHKMIIVQKRSIPVLVGFFTPQGKLIQVLKITVCDVRGMLQPCKSTETCYGGECEISLVNESSTGNLAVLAYGGAFLLAALLGLLVCCCITICWNRRKRVTMEELTNDDED